MPQTQSMDTTTSSSPQVRVWVDGCYDMVHFGHGNNFRQSKALGHKLIVGVHSDAEIKKHKGAPPVFTETERYALVRANKWVDQVVENAPYLTTIETLDKYSCDFSAHGDDITTSADGHDTYEAVKKARRYREVARTQGVSTTNLLKRILASEAASGTTGSDCSDEESSCHSVGASGDAHVTSPWTGMTNLIMTTQKLLQFSNETPPKPTDTIVYVAGTFDIFHYGHLKFLEQAAQLGDYLIVGIYSDDDSAKISPHKQMPIMSLNERCLNVLGCKYVSDIVIGAPLNISAELLDHLNVSVVAHGLYSVIEDPCTSQDLAQVAQQRGILRTIDSGCQVRKEDIIDRVAKLADVYTKRNNDKETKELKIISRNAKAARLQTEVEQ